MKKVDYYSLESTLLLLDELHDLETRCQQLRTELIKRQVHVMHDMRMALLEQERRSFPEQLSDGKEASPQKYSANRLMRLKEILPLLGVSRSTWYQGIKNGVFPRPTHLGPRTSVWRASDIERIVQQP